MRNETLKKLVLAKEKQKAALVDIESKIQAKRAELVPGQAEVATQSIFDFAGLFLPNGVAGKSYEKILEELKVLYALDPRYVDGLTSKDRYGLKQTPEMRYICETLLSGVLHQSANMWDVLNKIILTRKADGNPFTKMGE